LISPASIVESSVSKEELLMVLGKLEEALDGTDRGAAIVGLVALALMLQNPGMEPETLHTAIKDVSQYMCMYTAQETKNDVKIYH
jgi:hypothetical protein